MDKRTQIKNKERLAKLEYERRVIELQLEADMLDDSLLSDTTPELTEYNRKLKENNRAFLLLKLSRFNIDIEYFKNMCELISRP
jgi:hypothetical protein